MARVGRVVGILMMVVGLIAFFGSAFAIAAFGPWAISLVFVGMGLVAFGSVLAFNIGAAPAPQADDGPGAEPEPEEGMPDGPVERQGFGCGYCPNCGAPLSAGDSFCGVCGRRVRWGSSGATRDG